MKIVDAAFEESLMSTPAVARKPIAHLRSASSARSTWSARAACGELAGTSVPDEDDLMGSTVHSAKGEEWQAVDVELQSCGETEKGLNSVR